MAFIIPTAILVREYKRDRSIAKIIVVDIFLLDLFWESRNPISCDKI